MHFYATVQLRLLTKDWLFNKFVSAVKRVMFVDLKGLCKCLCICTLVCICVCAIKCNGAFVCVPALHPLTVQFHGASCLFSQYVGCLLNNSNLICEERMLNTGYRVKVSPYIRSTRTTQPQRTETSFWYKSGDSSRGKMTSGFWLVCLGLETIRRCR